LARSIGVESLAQYCTPDHQGGAHDDTRECRGRRHDCYRRFAGDLNGCFSCHKPQDKQDFVFTCDKLKTAAR
jgi:hypothetical protein